MTNEQIPKEFWIEQFNGRVPPSYYAFKDKPNFNKLKLKIGLDSEEINASEYFHVIEYSAYEEVKEQNEKLIKMIEVLNDENKLHIKLLEKVNDWAIAGNIENYSQLCDDLEKIQEDEK